MAAATVDTNFSILCDICLFLTLARTEQSTSAEGARPTRANVQAFEVRNAARTLRFVIIHLQSATVPMHAMPVAPLSGAPASVTLVAWGCAAGRTRGPWGRCLPTGYGAFATASAIE